MEVEVFKDLISNVGFPIIVSAALYKIITEFKTELVAEVRDINKNLNAVVTKQEVQGVQIKHQDERIKKLEKGSVENGKNSCN